MCVTINSGALNFVANPQVSVTVQRTDLPTFFARIWGRTAASVKASATAEAYNPSSLQGTGNGPGFPVTPTCVKPWLLPNMSPNPAPASPQIFDPASGAILDTNLLGWATPTGIGTHLFTNCTNNCGAPAPAKTAWNYYPGTTDPATGSFPAPSATSCTGCGAYNTNQLSVAGCVQTPIACNSTVNVDVTPDTTRDLETAQAVDNLTHSAGNGGDSVDTAVTTPPTGNEPFDFLAGTENPVVLSGALGSGTSIMVSNSLVTVPVIDTDTPNWPGTYPNNVQIIGFVQLFLSPTGQPVPAGLHHIHTQVINLIGCGDGAGAATGTPILGNGASPVAVRLIAP